MTQVADQMKQVSGYDLDEIADLSADAFVSAVCGKCGGHGVIYYGMIAFTTNGQTGRERWCFKCNGHGGSKVEVKVLRRRIKARLNRERKAEEKRVAKVEAEALKVEAAKAEFQSSHQDVLDELSNHLAGGFGDSLREQYERAGFLSEGQVAAVRRVKVERENAPEASPVVEGRIEIVGTIQSIKEHYSDYGPSLKMVVLDDRGFKVYGTLPNAVYEAERGRRIKFVGTVERSSDDESFGFFKRPAKAELLEV